LSRPEKSTIVPRAFRVWRRTECMCDCRLPALSRVLRRLRRSTMQARGIPAFPKPARQSSGTLSPGSGTTPLTIAPGQSCGKPSPADLRLREHHTIAAPSHAEHAPTAYVLLANLAYGFYSPVRCWVRNSSRPGLTRSGFCSAG
jgi:hypothetical protein